MLKTHIMPIFIAAMLLLVAALWQNVGSVGAGAMAKTATLGHVMASISTSATIMVWITVAFELVVTFGVIIMALSIVFLDRLTD
jgi:hypothetical protein